MTIEIQKEKHSDEEIFAQLHPLLTRWFKEHFGSFTEPQRYAILNIHRRQNTLITAPTGTGKTLSAFSAILSELITLAEQKKLEDRVYCIYISPLRALSNDIEKNLNEPLEAIKKMAKEHNTTINVRVAVRTGDTPTSKRAAMLRKPPHILITTPESLAIVLNSTRFCECLRHVTWVIVDEIHALAENKRGTHLSISLERLQELSPGLCRIGLSATISPLEEIAKFLVGMEGNKPRPCKIVDVRFQKKLDLKVLSPVSDMINVTQEELHEALYGTLDKLIQQHRTTLVFTNTRSATERVVNHLKEMFPKNYLTNVGAHHSSIGRKQRLAIENRLKKGELKVCVSSTSLELGIDIGYIDLVVLLGSPKSIARALQRIGRSGHKLHDVIKGRILVLDRDDLVECAVLLKNAVERKIDRVHIPKNCLDVLAQQIYGIVIAEKIEERKLYELIRRAYPYHTLSWNDFDAVLKYLSGEYVELEQRNVFAKIWRDKESGMIGRRGKLARVIYMTNVGTIPEEARIAVKIGTDTIGYIDEAFLERLQKGDVFVLGGEKYRFLYSRGMTIQVKPEEKRPPTVPNWVSEMLPLNFDLAMEIQRFRRLMAERLVQNQGKHKVLEFIHNYLYCDRRASEAIYNYFREQHLYATIPHDRLLLIEVVKEDEYKHAIVHSLYGRRTNDALSRALAWVVGKILHKDVAVSVTDNGFMLSTKGKMPIEHAMRVLANEDIDYVLGRAIEDSEILKRRFRHCATRALMILKKYRGREKSISRQQMSSQLLFNLIRYLGSDFPIMREARREVMEDYMDIAHAKLVLSWVREGRVKVKYMHLPSPSPFAFNIAVAGRSDLIKIDNKLEFIRRLHRKVMAEIGEDYA
jgi:ATP-dependent Lhr-like helicase